MDRQLYKKSERIHMKRIAVAIGLTVTVMLAGTFLWRNVNVQAMSVPVNVKDLPEHGVRIIPASDPSFDQSAEPFFKGQPQTIVDRVKPFSALLENTGCQAIVGSSVRWLILKRDGTTFSVPVSSVNPRALMDGEPKLIQTTQGAAIPPHSTRFVSVLGSAGAGHQVDLSRSWISFRGTSSEREEFQNALARGDMDEAFDRSVIGRVLTEAGSATISVELIFFEDGSFVGDDRSDFFEKVNADINAQYDLTTEVAVAQRQGRTTEEIFKHLGEVAAADSRTRDESPSIDRYSGKQRSDGVAESGTRSYADAYNRSKALYARAFIGMRDTLGVKEALSQKLQLLDVPRKQLRRR